MGAARDRKPSARHGTYSFLFWDGDDNAWEILSTRKGGYTWIFEQGDLEGRGHFERGFRHKRPDADRGSDEAVYYERKGPAAQVLVAGELPDPRPARRSAGEGRVLGINPTDNQLRAGWDGAMEMPSRASFRTRTARA